MFNIRIQYVGASYPTLFEGYSLEQIEEFLGNLEMTGVEKLTVTCTQVA